MKINKQKICHCSNFFLSEAEIQGLLHPAEANLGYFLAWFQSLQLPSAQPGSPRALLPLAPKSHVSFQVCTQLWTEILIFHFSIPINCKMITEGLLYLDDFQTSTSLFKIGRSLTKVLYLAGRMALPGNIQNTKTVSPPPLQSLSLVSRYISFSLGFKGQVSSYPCACLLVTEPEDVLYTNALHTRTVPSLCFVVPKTSNTMTNVKYREGSENSTEILCGNIYKKQTNSVALVRKRTIPTERPPLVGEVSANFCG
jgi:hypothetical protein